jgi:hypothetical protein
MLGWLREATALASRMKRVRREASAATDAGSERHLPVEGRVLGQVDLAHAASADRLEDLVVGDERPDGRGFRFRCGLPTLLIHD